MRRFVKIVVWTARVRGVCRRGRGRRREHEPVPAGGGGPRGAAERGVPDRRTPTRRASEPAPGSCGSTPARYHDLFVGGRCAANWRIDVGIAVADGPIDWRREQRRSRASCDATSRRPRCRPSASTCGPWGAARRRACASASRRPGEARPGPQELSGFLETIPTLRLEMPARDGATASFDFEIADGGQGTFGAVGSVVLTAAAA